MQGLAPYIVGALAAALFSDYLIGPARPFFREVPTVVDRVHKADRLAAPTTQTGKTSIAVVEVVGVQNTAIVYRDRNGRELFRTDPLSNATIVGKNVVLPEVTVKDRDQATVTPVPLDSPGVLAPGTLPTGCDPAVSRLSAPLLAQTPARCVT